MQIGNGLAITLIRFRQRGAIAPIPPKPTKETGPYRREDYQDEYQTGE